MTDFIDDFEGDVAEEAPEVSEEAPLGVRCNRRLTHKQVAHIPRPRSERKPNFEAPLVLPEALKSTIADDVEDSDEDVGAATAEPESESVAEAPQPGGLQKPMTFGSVDK